MLELKEVEVDQLLKDSKERSKKALQNIQERYCPPMSAEDHRAKAEIHDKKADELLSGEKKDSNLVAARAHRRAADAIDAANLSSRKTQAFQ